VIILRWFRIRKAKKEIEEGLRYLEAVAFYQHNGFAKPYDWDQK
jgi:hypothetical protein